MSAPSPASPPRTPPLSPHLQIYRWQLTMLMSILHRMAGVALAAGTLLILWMLMALAQGPEAYAAFESFVTGPLGMLMLFGWSAALCYHLCNGVRHLLWDTVHIFEIKNAYRAGYVVWLAAAALLAWLWLG